MPELRTLLTEAKTGLHELEQLLQKARGLSESFVSPSPTREEIQSYFAEILKLIEKIPQNLHLDADPQRRQEILLLHQEMEVVRERTESSLGQVEIACERNLRHLTDFVETLEQRLSSMAKEKQATPPMSHLSELLSQGKSCLESKDYESCVKLMSEALEVSPQDPEAAFCLEEAQRKWEDQQLEEELVIHIENLKRDAIHLFDQEKYSECIGTFKFLCELEPKNRTLQDYLELTKVRLQEIEDGAQSSSQASSAPQFSAAQSPTVLRQNLQEAENSLSLSSKRDSIKAAEAASSSNAPAEQSDKSTPLIASRKLWVVSAALAVLIGLVVALLNLKHGSEITVGAVNVESQPSGATVFIDDEVRGTTPLKLSSLPVGLHKLRVEMQGHTPASENLSIDTANPLLLSLTLSPLKSTATPLSATQLGKEAAELLESGKILDAHRVCNELLMLEPTNQTALTLKARIETSLFQRARLDRRQGKLQEARLNLEALLRLSPQHWGALQEMKRIKTRLKQLPETSLPHDPAEETVNDVRRQIAAAVAAGKYFPPATGNAFDLTQRLKASSPEDPVFRETIHLLHSEGMSQLRHKIQVKDTEGAKSLLKQLLTYFPESAGIKGLKESLNIEENRQSEDQRALLQKLDSLISRNSLVSPTSENALSLANRILAADPSNSKVLARKREILAKAASEASEMTSQLKFDEARQILSALAAATNDGRPSEEIKGKLNKLDFTTYPVAHDHTLGCCAGHLRVNGYVVEYVPTGQSKDGFSERLSNLVEITSGDKLKLQFKNKSYKFQPNSEKNKTEVRQKVEEMQQKIHESMGN